MVEGSQAQSCSLTTSDGVTLQAELVVPADPVATAVVCHPHPLYGGTMDNNVVESIFTTWRRSGVGVLRFNFRGSGLSTGQHDNGSAERLDVVAAIDELTARWPTKPLVVAGYSFGADVALAVAHEQVSAWFAIAPPLRVVPAAEMVAATDDRPKVIVSGSDDDFRPPDQVAAVTAGWNNTKLATAPGANHFFSTGLETVEQAASELLATLVDD